MKIYSRGGDEGETSLFGGRRVPKGHVRIHAYGEIDELNTLLGLTLALAPEDLAERLRRESSRLFSLGAHLATPPDASDARQHLPVWPAGVTTLLEEEIDAWDQQLPELKNFVLPAGTELAARLHLARAVCRRAERGLVSLREVEGAEAVDPAFLRYLNRLSDWLFVAARWANHAAGVPDEPWRAPSE